VANITQSKTGGRLVNDNDDDSERTRKEAVVAKLSLYFLTDDEEKHGNPQSRE
jgi:hypothetical protein